MKERRRIGDDEVLERHRGSICWTVNRNPGRIEGTVVKNITRTETSLSRDQPVTQPNT